MAAIGTVLGIGMVLFGAVPASAQNGSPNLLAASGVTFVPSQDDTTEPVAIDVTAPAMKFETPMAMAHAFIPRQADDPHTIGVGVRSGGYAYGFGGLLRWWFSQQLFLDIGAARHSYGSFLSHTVISGTVNYVIRHWDTNDVVVVRLYAGGGISMVRWSWDEDFYGTDYDSTAYGGHGLVGVELIFKQFPKLGIGGDAGFYSTNGNYFNYGGYGGFGSSIYAIWYFK
jgi:hypothetical protein